MVNRDSRTLETRENTERKVTWKRPSALPDPAPQEGVEYRWIRTASLGQADMTNVSSKFREGWEPVKLEDHPELKIISDVDSKFKGNVEVGGLLLCKNSKENMDARRRWILQLMRDGDCRLPKQADTKFNFYLTISG